MIASIAFLCLFSLAFAEDCLHSGFNGLCREKSSCQADGKAYVTGLCQGPTSVICCLGKSSAPPRCDSGGGALGACQITASCGGQSVKGKCLGYPNDVTCCVGGRHGSGATPPPAPPLPQGVTADGWLQSAGGFPVERIDATSRLRFFSSHRSPVNKFLLHTIEGGGPPFNGYWEGGRSTLDSKSYWPHFIVAKDRAGVMRIGQFISMQVEGRACKSPGNSVGTIQVEVGGRAAQPFTDYPELWEPVRALFQAVRRAYPAIANQVPPGVFFGDSNKAYGTGAPTRQTESALKHMSGLVGHQHVPRNTHWDPGAIDASKLLCLNRLCSATPAPTADDAPPATDAPTNGGGPTLVPSTGEPGEDGDDAPSCVVEGRPGRCRNTGSCRSAGGTPRSNSPPTVSGCGHIADADVQCCDGGDSNGSGNGNGNDDAPQPIGPACSAFGVSGTCVATGVCAASGGGRRSFSAQSGARGCESIKSADVQCCAAATATGVPAQNSPGCAAFAGLYFPLERGSLREISVNWGFSRSSGTRCHAGLDIYTSGSRHVVAVDSGRVVAIMRGWYTCSGGSIDAILVYHESGALAGKTINYGEVDPGTYSLSVGSRVAAGERIGVASRCGMLHFELYAGERRASQRWLPASGSVGAGCHKTSLSSKPAALLDPRPLLSCTQPADAKFRHGVSFVSEPADLALFEADAAADGEDDAEFGTGGAGGGLSGGAVAGIVVGVLLVCALVVALLVYALVLRPKRAAASHAAPIDLPNPLHQAPTVAQMAQADTIGSALGASPTYASGGEFVCSQCGKGYAYVEDLEHHVSMRH